MSVPTQHQRLNLWINDHGAVADEWLEKLYAAGARVATLQLQDAGEVPREKVDRWRALGFKVWGAVRPSGDPLGGGLWDPITAADWLAGEKRRLGLHGGSCNFEQEVQQADLRGEQWSMRYASRQRGLLPTLPLQLNTYPVEGLDHAPYIARGFRVSVQTYSPTKHWEWSATWIMDWLRRIGWEKGRCKVTLPVHEIDGARAPFEPMLADCKAAGVVGATLYPINQAMNVLDEYLVPFVRRSIALGVAR